VALFACLTIGCATSESKKDKSQIYLRLGTNHLLKGNYPQALASLLQAEALDPEDSVIQNNLGLAYFVRKEFSFAETHVKKALQIDPKYSDARNNLGRIYIEIARYNDAINELTQVVKDLTYSTVEKAYVNLGLAYLKKGDSSTTIQNFRKAIDANNKFCPAHNYYGQALFALQKYELSVDSFELALKLCNNDYDEAHYYSGLSNYKIGQKEKATARLEEVIKMYPDSEWATKAKAMLKIIR